MEHFEELTEYALNLAINALPYPVNFSLEHLADNAGVSYQKLPVSAEEELMSNREFKEQVGDLPSGDNLERFFVLTLRWLASEGYLRLNNKYALYDVEITQKGLEIRNCLPNILTR